MWNGMTLEKAEEIEVDMTMGKKRGWKVVKE
jgi:hypothetical protein